MRCASSAGVVVVMRGLSGGFAAMAIPVSRYRSAARNGEPGGHRLRGHRTREVVALEHVTTELAQPVALPLGFDAFGDHGHPERPGHLDYGTDDLLVDAALVEAVYEGAIELDRVQRQPLEIAQRGVPGTEVVEEHANAECVEPIERFDRLSRVAEQHRFGDLHC